MTNCLVIGGGIIGLLTARELADAGVTVTVVERGAGAAGHESSWAGGGILSPLCPWQAPEPVTVLARWGQARYAELAQALQEETGVDAEWTQSGMLCLDATQQAAALAWAGRTHTEVQVLTRFAVKMREPSVSDTAEHALWLPEVAQIRNPRLLRGLQQSLLKRRVRMLSQCEVTGLRHTGGQVTGVDSSHGRMSAGTVIVAGGAWSGQLLAGLVPKLDIQPVRGQMLLWRTKPGLVKRIIVQQEHYLIPRSDGCVLAGSTVEHVGFDKATTQAGLQELKSAAISMVPALAYCHVEQHWAGLRPGSPQGVPYIGAHPALKGLYVNTGHFRNGLVLAPASARLMADLVRGAPPIVEPAPYALAATQDGL
ncbi:MAG: glycine oxidase ThiO [Gammaproteobacteria bacterium]|nr:glycine oxidase ThiO [Gammaproteobacteria bacterium]